MMVAEVETEGHTRVTSRIWLHDTAVVTAASLRRRTGQAIPAILHMLSFNYIVWIVEPMAIVR